MNRTTFLTSYSVGTFIVMFTGYPWSQLNVLLLQPAKAGAALDTAFWLALVVPLVLIGVASARGTAIGRPRLLLFPLIAFCLSATAFVYGWLSRVVAGGESTAAGFLPMNVVMFLGLVSAFSPILLHIACCIAGFAPPATRRDPAMSN